MLLQTTDDDAPKRYEVEIQLGKTDASHIIRTIEYWDIERKRYPQYDHVAVIVAEEITGRFLNVIGLFAGAIKLMALQVNAIKDGEHVTLAFTRVVDEITRGLDDDDHDPVEKADRAYWEKLNKATLEIADEVLVMLRSFDSSLDLSYNKSFIGLARQGKVDNFVKVLPQKNRTRVSIKLPQSDEVDKMFDEAGLELMAYNGRYRPKISESELAENGDLFRKVLAMANKNAKE